MAIKVKDIAAILKDQISNYDKKVATKEVGQIITIGDGIVQASDLDNVMLNELVKFPNGVQGMTLNLESDNVGIVLLGSGIGLKEGDKVERTKDEVAVPVGDALIGRVLNALGAPLDGKDVPKTTKYRKIFRTAPGVMTREAVSQPLETGIIAIDSMIPIGKGQRELIIGDRQTGKTAIAIDTIINQRGKNVLCIYVAIGQKNSTIAQIVEHLRKVGAMEYTTIVIANAADPVPMQYIVPYSATAMAEEWMESGRDVLIVYDDLSKHAVAYRTLSLLLRRPPGREAYPGDIFYLHSQLLERAARVNRANGGGSITALPIVETQAGDISAYIPTNTVSITDGQIFTITSLFNAGQRPAIDIGYSVSRVGSSAQTKAMKKVVGSLKLELSEYNEMAAFAQFGSDLDPVTKRILTHGKKVLEVIKQPQYAPYSQTDQVLILLAVQRRLIAPIPFKEIARFKHELLNYFDQQPSLRHFKEYLAEVKELTDSLRENLLWIIAEFVKKFVKTITSYNPKDHEALPVIEQPKNEFKFEAPKPVFSAPSAVITAKDPVPQVKDKPPVSSVAPAAAKARKSAAKSRATPLQKVRKVSK